MNDFENDYDIEERPLFVSGVNVFGDTGEIANELFTFLDETTGNINPEFLPGNVHSSILNVTTNRILLHYFPSNLNYIENNLLISSTQINENMLSNTLQILSSNIFDSNGNVNSDYLPSNLEIMNNTFFKSDTDMEESFLSSNLQYLNTNLFENATQIKSSFLQANLQFMEHNLLNSNLEINDTFFTANLQYINTNFLDSNDRILIDYFPSNLQIIEYNMLTSDKYLNFEFFPTNSGFWFTRKNNNNNYYFYVSEDGLYANIGEYNKNTLVFNEYINVTYLDTSFTSYGKIAVEHRMNSTWSYQFLNYMDKAYIIQYPNNERPRYRMCETSDWPT